MRSLSLPLLLMATLIASSLFSAGTIISPGRSCSGLDPLVATSLMNTTPRSLVRIPAGHLDPWLFADIEIVSATPRWTDVIVLNSQLPLLSAANKVSRVLIDDVDGYSRTAAGDYHSLEDMERLLQEIAGTYPTITRLFSIGTSYEGRPIWCLEITDNPGSDEGEPEVFFMGLHHAREWPTVEICLYIAQTLTNSFATDSNIHDLINNRRIWIVPCVNPDGYHFSHDQGHDWRKNRHYFPETDTYGVDLNRNYPGSCNGNSWGAWGSLGVASVTHHPSQSTYCGPAPFSELETQAVRNMFLDYNITAAITFHTYGELVMWPWGYDGNDQVPDDDYISQVGQAMAARITTQSGTDTYTPVQAAGLYPTTGDTADWAYGNAHYVTGTTTFAFTIEACQEFQPPASALDQIVQENYDAALFLLYEAENISILTPRVLPPTLDDALAVPEGAYTISWEQSNPAARATRFQVDEFAGLDYVIDHAEADTGYWAFDGFVQDASQAHSGSHSYAAENGDERISSLVTTQPVPIVADQKLTFWCWYDIEENWDYAMVEVSKDTRYYEVLGTFTGRSEGWEYQEYDLSPYAGESVFIRFRYTTDSRTTGAGFFIDDIAPVADFSSIVMLADNISVHHIDILDREDGIYYYRVRGYNEPNGWGDFSTLRSIRVSMNNNTPPDTPVIDGPHRGNSGEPYTYEFRTTDAETDDVFYYIDWGDGTHSGWLGPYVSGESIAVEHIWNQDGSYDVKAKAKDESGIQSQWGTLRVSMPFIHHTLLERIIYWLFALLDSPFG